jgi:hypothetical protein
VLELRCMTVAALALLLNTPEVAAQGGGGRVRVGVESRATAPGYAEFSGSMTYRAILMNESTNVLTLKAEQSPGGGFAGSGKPFGCSLEQWDTHALAWRTVREYPRNKLIDGSLWPLTDVKLPPGAKREACTFILPHDGGAHEARVRIRVWRSPDYRSERVSWVSEPFVIHPRS